jgi:hypothetical protein
MVLHVKFSTLWDKREREKSCIKISSFCKYHNYFSRKKILFTRKLANMLHFQCSDCRSISAYRYTVHHTYVQSSYVCHMHLTPHLPPPLPYPASYQDLAHVPWMIESTVRNGIFKLLRSPGIDSAGRAGMTTLFGYSYSVPSPNKLF